MALGFVTKNALADWQNVPLYLPNFQFHERHRTTITTAYPEKILPAIAGYDIQQDIVIKTLMAVRKLPQKLRRHQSESAIDQFGLQSFTLLENSPTELCYGLRGQFWRTDFGLEDVPVSVPIAPRYGQAMQSCCCDIRYNNSPPTNMHSVQKPSYIARTERHS